MGDVIKVKQRQLDRSSEENESLLQQMDTYCSQLKVVSKEKAELEKKHDSVKDALSKSEAQAKKAMELEANIICMKENEKQSQSRLKKIEQELGIEKKKNEEKE